MLIGCRHGRHKWKTYRHRPHKWTTRFISGRGDTAKVDQKCEWCPAERKGKVIWV